jgi:hypothetical protein
MKEGERRGMKRLTYVNRERLVSERRFDHAVFLETGWGGGGGHDFYRDGSLEMAGRMCALQGLLSCELLL